MSILKIVEMGVSRPWCSIGEFEENYEKEVHLDLLGSSSLTTVMRRVIRGFTRDLKSFEIKFFMNDKSRSNKKELVLYNTFIKCACMSCIVMDTVTSRGL